MSTTYNTAIKLAITKNQRQELTSYWCRSLSGSSAKKWLALTMQLSPMRPFPGRKGNLNDLLEAGATDWLGSLIAAATDPLTHPPSA
ncbi:hypothetical protein HanXRQr2_Chr14g0651451 [Helianthus annuus]|uniref:Uncharacterized protein n=1 Tax=Helianthus annuus TaxID=4232 RepID=A0A9K3EA09_HELAN|nr:hypothetical protein HanXRQr2_Chr14g0651451 [Helianthus annuus]